MNSTAIAARQLPNIFLQITHLHRVQIGYDDNIIGDERWVMSSIDGSFKTFLVKTVQGSNPIIKVRNYNIEHADCDDRVLIVNEDMYVYSDRELEYIRQTFKFFMGVS